MEIIKTFVLLQYILNVIISDLDTGKHVIQILKHPHVFTYSNTYATADIDFECDRHDPTVRHSCRYTSTSDK